MKFKKTNDKFFGKNAKETCTPCNHHNGKTKIPYVYAAFPVFLTVANATFLLRKRKKSDGNLLDSPLILAGWERNVRFLMLLRNKMLRNTFITLLMF